MVKWETVKCTKCGWAANRMLREKVLERICPYCFEKGLVPS